MIIANLVGISTILLIIWWFWIYKPEQVSMEDDNLLITVESGTYTPARIKIQKHKATTLTFLRKDPSPCAETLLIPDLNISENLILDKAVTIGLPKLNAGTYGFHCQMKMYKGEICVT
jgi:plastocyanin domain-containing protein